MCRVLLYITGDVMPQTGMNYEGRRRGTRRSTCKANGLAPGTDLVNGAVVHNGYPAAATRTNETTPAGTLNGTKPQCTVNGYINHKYKSRNAPQPRTLRKHGSTIPAVSDASTAGWVNSADDPGGISVNGAASLDTVASHSYSDQMTSEPVSLSAPAKKRRRWKKFGRKKRCVTCRTASLINCSPVNPISCTWLECELLLGWCAHLQWLKWKCIRLTWFQLTGDYWMTESFVLCYFLSKELCSSVSEFIAEIKYYLVHKMTENRERM